MMLMTLRYSLANTARLISLRNMKICSWSFRNWLAISTDKTKEIHRFPSACLHFVHRAVKRHFSHSLWFNILHCIIKTILDRTALFPTLDWSLMSPNSKMMMNGDDQRVMIAVKLITYYQRWCFCLHQRLTCFLFFGVSILAEVKVIYLLQVLAESCE